MKKKTIKKLETRLDEANNNQKIKSIIDFDETACNSIKYLAVKKDTTIKVTASNTSGKMLMFAKVSLQGFAYNIIDAFCCLSEEIKDIYKQNQIIKCFIYFILTDTGSCSISFTIVCKINSTITESNARKLSFQIMLISKLRNRLDPSDEYYILFDARNESPKNKLLITKLN